MCVTGNALAHILCLMIVFEIKHGCLPLHPSQTSDLFWPVLVLDCLQRSAWFPEDAGVQSCSEEVAHLSMFMGGLFTFTMHWWLFSLFLLCSFYRECGGATSLQVTVTPVANC